MKSSLETLSPTRVKLVVEVPFEELDEHVTAAYKRIGGQINVPGFRKGKVPALVIDQRVGRGAVLDEAVNEALPRVYDSAVREHSVRAMGQPQVEITELNDGSLLAFTAEVDIRPEFELPDYVGIPVQVADSVVTDQDVADRLDSLRKRFAELRTVERAAVDEDLVQLDIEGTIDGEVVEGYTASAFSYEVGSEGLVDGGDEALRGLSAGKTAEISFTPDEGEFAGREVKLAISVTEVRERELPTADDEFAQLASEFDTLDELVADLRSRLERVRLAGQGYAAREKVVEALLGLADIPVPEGVVAAEVEQHFGAEHGDAEDHAHSHGDDDDEEHRAEVGENVRKSMRMQFILDKIADAGEMSVGQDEFKHWLSSNAPQYGMTADQFAEALVRGGQVQTAVADARRAKALALVLEKASITDESGRVVDLSRLDAPEDASEPEAAGEPETAAEES